MLPSTGYFKGISCPFYDTGFCERPYCHFRHVKKEPQNGDGIESGEIFQKLMSAVQKVLSESSSSPSSSLDNVQGNKQPVSGPTKATYSPTPIAELNKINTEAQEDFAEKKRRHIPVPYTPRKPTTLPIKRPIDTNDSKLYVAPVVKYTPGAESAQLDPYTPKGAIESSEKYQPGTEAKVPEYLPDTQDVPSATKHSYVPSDKTSKSKIPEYKPTIVAKKNDIPAIKYQPTPKTLVPCFSSDEEEPEPKKQKVSGDLNGFDDLGPEFDILDQILDEENKTEDVNLRDAADTCKENITTNSENQTKSLDQKSSKNSKDKNKDYKKSKHSDHKSSHKSSYKEKYKDEKSEKKAHSSSKSETKSSKSKSDRHSSNRHSKSDKSSEKSKPSKTEHSKHKEQEQASKQKEKDSKSSKESKDSSKSRDHHKSHKKSKDKKRKRKERDKSSISPQNENNNSDGLELIDDEVLSESDEETIAEECKRIFEEYVPEPKTICEEVASKQNEEETEKYIPTKKRISRAVDKNIQIAPKLPVKPDFKVSAAQAMAERLSKIRQFHASKTEQKEEIPVNNKIVSMQDITRPTTTTTSSKVRIAHVPYASTLLTAKKSISTPVNRPKVQPSTSFTSIQTVRKGEQRVAHVPNEKFIDRPGVLEPLGSKIAANIRSTYLNLMIDQCLKIYLSATDAYARAQHEELATSKKCSTVPIYKNSAVLAISRLKKELQECNGVKKSGTDCATLQKLPDAKVDKANSLGSWSIENRSKKIYDSMDQYSGAKFYNNIKKWILTEEQLQQNGFPRPHSSGDKGRAIIYGQNKQKPPKGLIRTCCRCKKDYTVDKKGFPVVKEECIYHPNNKYRVRGEVKYQCCSQDGTSDGCCVAESHVYEYVDFDNLKGFVRTLPPEREMEDYGVYSLDCEMCYTTHGLDLTRVTVINSSCKVIYETLIKPLHPIIDYNTRYSGITEEQMAQVKTTLLEVQATLLTMFNSKTILIGHSLESDFKALKLIHDTVIDTSVLFPHKMGPPFKRALRNLSSEYLKKIIQNSVDGHDSAEDATVCMELLQYKLKEDLKTR